MSTSNLIEKCECCGRTIKAAVLYPVFIGFKPFIKIPYCYHCGQKVHDQKYCHGCGSLLDWNNVMAHTMELHEHLFDDQRRKND